MAKFPEYKYGGKSSDYEIVYKHDNSGKFFKSLVAARKYAISYGQKEVKEFDRNYGFVNPYYYQREYITMYCFYKYKTKGSDIVYRQQSGKSDIAGYVSIANDDTRKNKDTFAWIDYHKKSDSRIINKEGQVIRKITKADKDKIA